MTGVRTDADTTHIAYFERNFTIVIATRQTSKDHLKYSFSCKIVRKTFYTLPFQRQLHLHSTQLLSLCLRRTQTIISFFSGVQGCATQTLHGNMLQTCRLLLTSIYTYAPTYCVHFVHIYIKKMCASTMQISLLGLSRWCMHMYCCLQTS